jgi:hypothetical protein
LEADSKSLPSEASVVLAVYPIGLQLNAMLPEEQFGELAH